MNSRATNFKRHSNGLAWLLGCLGFVATLRCEAQGNLVPNHSFEIRDTCSGLNQVHYPDTGPLGWFSAGWTPDYYQMCLGSGASFGVPLSYCCYQSPQDGEAFAGVITYDQMYGAREYFMTELVEPLIPGQTYYASFYANAGWGGSETYPQLWLASSGVGLLFTMQARQWEVGDPVPMGVGHAQVHYPAILSDTVEWMLVSGSFVADSAYQYVMVGNQFNNAGTDTLHFADFPWNPLAYTLVDNVCVSTDPSGCPLSASMPDWEVEAPHLYPNPARDRLSLIGVATGIHLSVLDAVGRCVWTGTSSDGRVDLYVGDWSRGMYVLQLVRSGESRSYKFVLIE